jgi:hypothetical protein
MVTITLSTTGTIKGNLIEMAFEECGSAGFEFERTPEEIASALRELEAMMREHPFNLLGYNHSGYGVGLTTEASGIPDSAISVVAKYLGFRITPKMGATLSPESRASMARSLLLLQSELATVPTVYMPGGVWTGAGVRGASTTPVIEP